MCKIDGNTSVYGLIGYPVRHTLSPAIHNRLAAMTKISSVYLPFEVAGEVESAVRGAFLLGIQGLNVTVPYKNTVISALSAIDPEAERIGAVNTLVKTQNGYKGYNTDVIGLRRELKEAGVSLFGKKIVILGAGGAARATAMMCAADGAAEIYFLNRSYEKAVSLAEAVHQYTADEHRHEVIVRAHRIEEYHKLQNELIAFQCTSVGLYPNVNEVVISDSNFYKKLDIAVDLIYRPKQTRFMELVKQEGGVALNGSKMLIYQAVAAYELWNHIELSEELIGELINALHGEGLIDG